MIASFFHGEETLTPCGVGRACLSTLTSKVVSMLQCVFCFSSALSPTFGERVKFTCGDNRIRCRGNELRLQIVFFVPAKCMRIYKL